MDTDTLIVGGGLSGLSLAVQLAARGQDFQLVEARDRLGGRILGGTVGAAHFDLGPAWFWPGQPRMAALVEALGLQTFDQYASGDIMFEDASGQPHRGQGFASMQGSYRLKGGFASLINAMTRQLDAARLRLGTPIMGLARISNGIEARTADGGTITAQRCVLALPPRVATRLTFAPALPDQAQSAMAGVPTWMAGQAKAVAVYDRPFWREAGLSGDATSRAGPLIEVHDASPAVGGPFALFGFIGTAPAARQSEARLRTQISAQLVRLFGPAAEHHITLLIKDWAFDPCTATELDLQPLYAHPDYGLPAALSGLWDKRLIFAGTEVAPRFGGYLEGALEAAETVLVSRLQKAASSD